jgi:hypothetical protein
MAQNHIKINTYSEIGIKSINGKMYSEIGTYREADISAGREESY